MLLISLLTGKMLKRKTNGITKLPQMTKVSLLYRYCFVFYEQMWSAFVFKHRKKETPTILK